MQTKKWYAGAFPVAAELHAQFGRRCRVRVGSLFAGFGYRVVVTRVFLTNDGWRAQTCRVKEDGEEMDGPGPFLRNFAVRGEKLWGHILAGTPTPGRLGTARASNAFERALTRARAKARAEREERSAARKAAREARA